MQKQPPLGWLVILTGLFTMLSGCSLMNGFAMNESGRAYFQHGNYAMARDEFHRAIIDDPTNPDYIYNLATAMKKQGDVVTAEQTYRHAMKLDPAHQPSYHGLAKLLMEQNRQAEAVDLMEQWVATQPYSSGAHIEMAWLQRRAGDLAGAEKSLLAALRNRPDHPIALAQLGQLYEETGQAGRAIAMYQRSLGANWNQPQVRSRLAALKKATRPTWSGPTMTAGYPGWPQQPAYAGPYGPPQHAPYHQPMPVYTQSPAYLTTQPGSVINGPVELVPPIPNADPAHVPQANSHVPVVQPY